MYSRPALKYQKKFCFVSKQACIIAYEVRISCKGALSFELYVFVTSKTNIMFSNSTRGRLLSNVSIM